MTVDDLDQGLRSSRRHCEKGGHYRMLVVLLGRFHPALFDLFRRQEARRDQAGTEGLIRQGHGDRLDAAARQVYAAVLLKILDLEDSGPALSRQELKHAEQRKLADASPENHEPDSSVLSGDLRWSTITRT